MDRLIVLYDPLDRREKPPTNNFNELLKYLKGPRVSWFGVCEGYVNEKGPDIILGKNPKGIWREYMTIWKEYPTILINKNLKIEEVQ